MIHFGQIPRGVFLILLGFVVLGLGYAFATPAWNNPDEPAHFNYAATISERMQLPVLVAGDWDSDRLEALKAKQFAGPANIEGVAYEAHQPPLYYALLAPLHRVTLGLPIQQQVLALRMLSVLLGAGLVLATALLALRIRPRDQLVATLSAGFVAFLPMHTAMAAAINNDALANLLGALLLLVGVEALLRGTSRGGAVGFGLLLGAALLTKTTLYALLPLLMVAVARGWVRDRSMSGPLLASIVGTLMAGWWFIRNGLTYGWLDLLGSARHDEVVVGQLRTSEASAGVLGGMLTTLQNSFWGNFGWMGIPLHDPVYRAYDGLLVLAVLGGLLLLLRPAQGRPSALAVALLVASVAAVAAALFGYNLKFVQPQGRYLFPALSAIGVLFALGLAHLLRGEGLAPWVRWVACSLVLLAAGALMIETGAPLGADIPRRILYPLLLLVAVALPALTARTGWSGPGRLSQAALGGAVVTASLAFADAAVLLGVVAPSFR